MIVAALLGHLAGMELTESVLEIGEGAFGLTDLDIVLAEDIGVAGGLADELGGLEELALGLDALVDILDLLVQLVRLWEEMNGVSGTMGGVVRTMADWEWTDRRRESDDGDDGGL